MHTLPASGEMILEGRPTRSLDIVVSKLDASKASGAERPPDRRANSSGSGSNQHQLRSQHSFEVDKSRRRSQSSTGSGSELRDMRHGHGVMHGYAYESQVPPIPALPYTTEDSSAP